MVIFKPVDHRHNLLDYLSLLLMDDVPSFPGRIPPLYDGHTDGAVQEVADVLLDVPDALAHLPHEVGDISGLMLTWRPINVWHGDIS